MSKDNKSNVPKYRVLEKVLRNGTSKFIPQKCWLSLFGGGITLWKTLFGEFDDYKEAERHLRLDWESTNARKGRRGVKTNSIFVSFPEDCDKETAGQRPNSKGLGL